MWSVAATGDPVAKLASYKQREEGKHIREGLSVEDFQELPAVLCLLMIVQKLSVIILPS